MKVMVSLHSVLNLKKSVGSVSEAGGCGVVAEANVHAVTIGGGVVIVGAVGGSAFGRFV